MDYIVLVIYIKHIVLSSIDFKSKKLLCIEVALIITNEVIENSKV